MVIMNSFKKYQINVNRSNGIKNVQYIIRIILICVLFIVFMFPVYWVLIGSFKSQNEFYQYPPTFWPVNPSFSNFKPALFQLGGIKGIKDSLFVAILNTLIVLGIGLPLAYSIGRFKFGGGNISFFVLSLLFAPPVIAAVPLFNIFNKIGLIDKYAVLILSHILFNLPFAVWLMKGFFEEVPIEIENAALLDGYRRFHVFWKYILPLTLPGISVTALFVFIFSWNEFLFGLIFTRYNVRTLPIILSSLVGADRINWCALSTLSLFAIIPGIVLVLFFQKYIVRGLTFGAVKG